MVQAKEESELHQQDIALLKESVAEAQSEAHRLAGYELRLFLLGNAFIAACQMQGTGRRPSRAGRAARCRSGPRALFSVHALPFTGKCAAASDVALARVELDAVSSLFPLQKRRPDRRTAEEPAV